MRLPLFSLIAALAVGTATAGGADPEGANGSEVLSRLQEATASYETLQFTITQEIAAMGQSLRATGRVQASGERMAMRMTMHMPNGMMMEQRTVTTADTAWTYVPMMNLVSKIDLARVREAAPELRESMEHGAYNFAAALENEDVRYLGPATIADTATEHFVVRLERVPFAQGPQMPNLPAGGRTEVWLGATDGMPRQLQIYDAQGQAVFTQQFENIVVNEEIPAETFDFVPPEGAQVIDMTDMMLQMARMEGTMQVPSPPAEALPSAPSPAANGQEP